MTPLLCATTLPLVIFGAFGIALVEVLVADPLSDDLRRLVSLLGGLEETERAQDAVAGLDEVVAGETGELAELGDELLVDLAGQLVACEPCRHLRNDEWWHAYGAPSVLLQDRELG